ncbi:unnamed protein product, partial [Mesorhabditis belari]|uniref:Protein kinase domain-containing protein n=1 Tax=Mesorhabditis belari TaxID=2138241 RepID=A0AAF3F7T9_9BILA
MSPEILFLQGKISPKSDIYGMGLVLWEIIERKYVFMEFIENNRFQVSSFKHKCHGMNLKEIDPLNSIEELKQLVYSCTSFDRASRWDASQGLQHLKKLKEKFVLFSKLPGSSKPSNCTLKQIFTIDENPNESFSSTSLPLEENQPNEQTIQPLINSYPLAKKMIQHHGNINEFLIEEGPLENLLEIKHLTQAKK